MHLNVIADLLFNLFIFPAGADLLTGELLALRQVPRAHAAVPVGSADEGRARLAGTPAGQRDRRSFGTTGHVLQKVLTAHEPHVQCAWK